MSDVWESAGITVERWESNTTPGQVLTVVIRDGDIVASVSDEQLQAALAVYFAGRIPVFEGDGAGGALAGEYPDPALNTDALAAWLNALIVDGTGIETVFDPGAGEADPTLTISATGGGAFPQQIISSNAAITAPGVVLVAAAVTATMPDAESNPRGLVEVIAGADCTVQCASGDQFDVLGTTSISMATGDRRTFRSFDVSGFVPGLWLWTPISADGPTFETGADLSDLEEADVDHRIRDLIIGQATAELVETSQVFQHTGTPTGAWSTPKPADFTVGFEYQFDCIPQRPPSTEWFSESMAFPDDDEETDGDDIFEAALTPGSSLFGHVDWELRLFGESISEGADSEVANRLNVAAFGLPWGLRYRFLILTNFSELTVDGVTLPAGTTSGWVKVPYALDDHHTYITHPTDGHTFLLLDIVTDPGYTSIKSTTDGSTPVAGDWLLGKNFVGAQIASTTRDGWDGTLVADPDARLVTPGASSFVDGAGNTWTAGAAAEVMSLAADVGDAAEVPYDPAAPGNWSVAPDDTAEALDTLAAALLSAPRQIVQVTTSATATAQHRSGVVMNAASPGTINLPAGSNGDVVLVKRHVEMDETVTVDPNGTETVDGAETLALAQGEGRVLVFTDDEDGPGWYSFASTKDELGTVPERRALAATATVGYGSPTALGLYTAGALAIAAGAMSLQSSDLFDVDPDTLIVRISATSLTAGQQIIVVCYDEGPDGLPTTLRWSQAITVGTTTGVIEQAVTGKSLPSTRHWLGILNPSTNAGSVSPLGVQVLLSSVGRAIGTNSMSLTATSQGSSAPADTSAYTLSTSGGATQWGIAANAPALWVR